MRVRTAVAKAPNPGVNAWAEWVPDPFGWKDYAKVPVFSTGYEFCWGDFLLPRRRRLTATILTSEGRSELARAVQELAANLPDLPPEVHGFRRPFTTAVDELAQLERFNASCRTAAENLPWVVVTDIEDCFAHISLGRLEQLLDSFGSSSSSIARLLTALRIEGVASLPRDYVEFRFLSNLYLQLVDADIREPFVRYADDYRIYCSTRREAERALSHMTSVLVRRGFRPNARKTFVACALDHRVSMKALSFRPVVTAILRGSHPLETLRDAERSVLLASLPPGLSLKWINDPVTRREEELNEWVDAAITSGQDWLLARLLSPLHAVPDLSSDVADRLAAYCERSSSASIRGVAIATLARSGHLDQVQAMRRQHLDSRFELLACAALGESAPSQLARRWPGLDESLITESLSPLCKT